MVITPSVATKARYEALDGLRGLAALTVLIFHISYFSRQDWLLNGFLAVDLFFILSGFVVANAYEATIAAPGGWKAFGKLRFIRMYPLMALGALLGAGIAVVLSDSPCKAALLPLHLLAIPALSEIDIFPLNPVQWSLFFEIFANLLHASVLAFLSRKALVFVLVISGLLLAGAAAHFGTMLVGWSSDNFIAGFPRVVFSYTFGILLYRLHIDRKIIAPSFPWWAVLLFPFAAIVFVSLPGIRNLTWVREFAVVAIVFPIAVWVGLSVMLPQPVRWICQRLGAISYPLYAIQYPLILAFAGWLATVGLTRIPELVAWAFFALVCVLIAGIVNSHFDVPIREALRRILTRRGAPPTT